MKKILLRVDCLTNMHVGSGDVSYSVIDNQVERDPVLGVPEIHSSGVKGAFREHFEKENIPGIEEIFGKVTLKGQNEKETSPGTYKFMNANMIARPMRVSKGNVSYIKTTSVDIINTEVELLRNLGISKVNNVQVPEKPFEKLDHERNSILVSDRDSIEEVEGMRVDKIKESNDENRKKWVKFLEMMIDKSYAVMDSQTFLQQDLPVVARNCLDEKGISKNLWYEEIVPHKSIFYIIILTLKENKNFLENVNGKVIQFGGNASIGYGFTKIRNMNIS